MPADSCGSCSSTSTATGVFTLTLLLACSPFVKRDRVTPARRSAVDRGAPPLKYTSPGDDTAAAVGLSDDVTVVPNRCDNADATLRFPVLLLCGFRIGSTIGEDGSCENGVSPAWSDSSVSCMVGREPAPS